MVEPLTPSRLLTAWTFDPVAALGCVGAAVAYAQGIARLRVRGRSWSARRSTSFFSGIAAIVIATQSGLAAYDTTLFSAHVAQHVLLGVVAPLLLALGAPVTLALQAAHRPTQVNIIRWLRMPVVRVLGHPVTAWLLFGSTLFVLYFSPLYELSLRNGVVHAWVHLHFVVVGSLFFWAAIGLDPVAHRIPHGARLLLIVLTVPFHAFLGLALMSTTEPLAGAYYAEQARAWGDTVLGDQRTGAALMWLVGDVVGVVCGIVVAQSWYRHDQRRAHREDRRLDRLDALSREEVG
jgi:cytochrome c oxidase assembly factor CtaG